MHFLAAITLLILPGTWVSLGLRESALPLSARLALAVVLSPFVAGIQFLGARTVGIGFETAVWLVVAVNLPALILLVRAVRPALETIDWRAVIVGSVTFLAVAACAAIPWLAAPEFRSFSFHGLVHTDVVYAFANGAILPEDSELMGVALAYPWLGHAYWAVIAWAADLSPTLMYVVTNLALVAAVGVLIYTATRMLGANQPIALGATLLAALGPNLPGLVGWSLVPLNANGVWWAVAGDPRYTPFLLKFVQFEVMAFGIALLAAMVPVAVAAVMYKKRHDPVLAAVLTAAVAATYPMLFPIAFVLLPPILVAPYFMGRPPRLELKHIGGPAALLAGITVMAVLFLLLYTESQVSHIVSISSARASAKKTVSASLTFGPLLWLGLRAWRASDDQRRRAQLVLLGGVLTGVGLNIGLRIGAGLNEYKLVIGAGLCAIPAAAVGLQTLLVGRRRAWAVPAIGVTALALVMIAFSILRDPTASQEQLAIDESSFWLRLRNHPDRAWTETVRAETPRSTIVIVYAPAIHPPTFTGRALLVPSEADEPRIGYGMSSSRYFLLAERGYDEEQYDTRFRLLERVYASTSVDPQAVLDQLLSYNRPLAIVFTPDQRSVFRTWLEAEGVTKLPVADSDGTTVYFISTAEEDG